MMTYRTAIGYVLLIALLTFLVGCQGSPSLSSIQVRPATATVSTGTPVQFTATGTYIHGSHPAETKDITNSVTWASSSPGVASINSAGLATGVSSGTTSVTATMSSSFGIVTGTAILGVTGTGPAGRDLISLAITPGIQTLNTLGETAQFIVIGTFSSSPTTQNMAGLVTWQSSDTSIASVNSSGLVTAVGCGTSTCVATITASATAQSGAAIVGSATLNVSPGAPAPQRTLTNITIIPGNGTQIIYAPGETARFLAIGTFTSNPVTQDITDLAAWPVTWESADVDVATINSTGLATAVSCNSTQPPCATVITARAKSLGTTGADIVGTSNLGVFADSGASKLPSLAVYSVGSGTGTVVSSDNVIDCSAGQGCTGFFTSGASVQLTATPSSGSTFGGWSANCTPVPGTPTVCKVVMSTNQTVGAIFNAPPPTQ